MRSGENSVPPGPLALDDAPAIGELREVLVAAGYHGKAVREALGNEPRGRAPGTERPFQRRQLAERGAFGTITALFALDAPVPTVEARRALAPLPLKRLQRMGLLDLAGDLVRARARLLPHNDLLLASDHPQPGPAREADRVAGVQGPSVTLSHLTVRRSITRALDVGTGCGFQALLAARHADRVVASDVNERALNFTAFNALLNGVQNLELRAGSLFEPAGSEPYGLIVCNPPYVISPENAYLVRDSGLQGDTVSREVVRQAALALAEGAFATVLVSWVHHPGEEWSARPRAWVADTGCDALLLHYGTQDPLTHSAAWAREPTGSDEAAFGSMLDRWLAYLAGEGIDGIAYGAIVLRRRAGPAHWVAAQKLPASGLRPAGEQILRIFAAHDLLVALPAETALLDHRFALVEAAVVEQRVVLRDGGWSSEAIEIRLDEGLIPRARLDPTLAHLLALLDGKRTLAEVTAQLAHDREIDPAASAARAVPVVRGFLELGLLRHNEP